jgi:hypothetical protein
MRNLINIAFFLSILASLFQPAVASDISILANPPGGNNYSINNDFLLSGEIRKGDAEKLAKAFMQARPYPMRLTLNSPGGEVEEALRIVSLVKALRLPITEVEGGGTCASACFFIYLAGDMRNAAGTIDGVRASQIIGYIGLHRPYVKSDSTKRDGSTDAEKRQHDLIQIISSYLRNEDVHQRLIDLMMSRSSADIYWMTRDDIVELGYDRPALEELLISRCGDSDTRIAADLWKAEHINYSDAHARAKARSYALGICSVTAFPDWDEERLTNTERLRKGWRPWLKSKVSGKKQ